VAVLKAITGTLPVELDDRQRQAVEHVHGPMLVVAGAGTGKTTVLTRRIAHLIRDAGVRPGEILALTYTDNAAREMRERVEDELRGTDTFGLQVGTFHAYCNNLLIRTGRNFGVLDDKDLWIYLRKRIRELRLNYFVRAANVGQFLDDLLDFMRRCHDELVGPEKYTEYVDRLERGELPLPRIGKAKDALGDDEVLARCREIASVFATVERMLRDDNLGTFGHMITKAYDLLQQDKDLLAQERPRARFILVDEFQDANFAQVKILQKLAGEERNVFAVGDPDQAIYRFRGASSAAFGLFQRHFPGARLVVLEKNRRSTTPILNCAFALIAKNPDVFPGGKGATLPYERAPLISAREEEAARQGTELPRVPVDVALLTDKEVECSDVVNTILEKKKSSRGAWNDFAVLYRLHNHRDKLAEELAEQGIPFSIENMDVVDTPAVRDLFACLGAVVSAHDGASLFRVAALPQFAIDPEKLRAEMRTIPRDERSAGLPEVLARIAGGAAVLATVEQAREEIARTAAKGRRAVEILIRTFALDGASRPLDAVLDFVSGWEEKPITRTKELGELVEYLEYFREAKGAIPMPTPDQNAVHLITAHAAKGLEFDHVFILRANSGSFPVPYREPLVEFPSELRDPDSVAQGEGKTLHDQEERRLFYVAMTRARDSLTIYARKGKGHDPTPAGYLRDLLKSPGLSRWLRSRQARPFQTDMFGETSAAACTSRTSEWISLPPAQNLNARLSATAVASYDLCPLQLKLEREWNLPHKAPAALHYGGAMHLALRAYYDSVRAGRPLAEDALIDLFRANLAAAGIQDRYQFELYQQQGIEQLRDFLSVCARSSVPEVLHTEETFQVQIGDATVVGRIDRIDRAGEGRVAITDYKTGKPRSQEDADESLQLSIYALAARAKWGYDVDCLIFYNLQENAPVTSYRSTFQLEEAKLKIAEVASNIAAGKFEPKAGFHCGFCAYRNLCPATEKRLYDVPSAPRASGAKN
jgi:superfamily I DNA/RNA helicase/RecB family exonuclease